MEAAKPGFLDQSNHKQWLLVPAFFLSTIIVHQFIDPSSVTSTRSSLEGAQKRNQAPDCLGRYIYVQKAPRLFNRDLVDRCETITAGTEHNMCPYLANFGIGPKLRDKGGVLLRGSWYRTNQFTLSVIFHNRIRNYECLTDNSSLATAIYVPFYAGLDVSRYLWSKNVTKRDQLAVEFANWIGQTREWQRLRGRDHFLVSGRIAGDFRREDDQASSWGSRLRLLPETRNMSMITVEASIWSNDHSIPYPTGFHPSHHSQVFHWQNQMRRRKRRYLFAFAGAPRPKNPDTLRAGVVDECRGSGDLCKLLECDYGPGGAIPCDDPVKVVRLFRSSAFCLQPRGDSYTRRSLFESILAGCIPVLFHPGSAYSQYQWYLPKNHSTYSVYIPVENEGDWRPGIVNETLLGIPEDRVKAMREEVIGLIPKVIYADPRSRLEKIEDAFDIAVRGILERIEMVRKETEDGKDPAGRNISKFNFSLYGPGDQQN